MKKIITKLGLTPILFMGAMLLPAVALADGNSVNFEPSTYAIGSISGQDGWSNAVSPSIDQGVVANSYGYGSFGSQTFRMSDAYTDGAFGDWVFAKPLTDSAGETAATDGTFATGTKQAHYEAQFDIASTQSTQQPGMHMSVSPDRGDGSRMSYLRFVDQTDGIHVFFDDVTDPSHVVGADSFNETEIAILDRSTPHTVKFWMNFMDGPDNDVVKIYIDGVLKITGTSWEDYYRFDPEASAEQSPRIVKTLIFQSRTGSGPATNPADQGQGFLIDNLTQFSGPASVKVTIDKFIDGNMSTAATANSSAFPMAASWSADNIGSGSGTFSLSTTGFNSPNAYEAVTADMTTGASYATNEDTSGSVVGDDCSSGKPYALVGYKSGDTLSLAEASVISLTAPSFINLLGDKVVLVINKPCLPAPVNVFPADGATLTPAAWVKADWTDVSDPFTPTTYFYESSNSAATNSDGSFSLPAYVSGALSVSEIPTTGTPVGTWYWHARGEDADGNLSPWSAATKVIVVPPPTFLKVHVLKYLNGQQATSTSAAGYLFPMTATWNTSNIGAGSGNYVLGNNFGGAADLYGADTASMQAPADYTTSEITSDIDPSSKVLSASAPCQKDAYRLVGYSTSAVSFGDAANQPTTVAAPAFTGLTADQYVIVRNESCNNYLARIIVQKVTIGGDGIFHFTTNSQQLPPFNLQTVNHNAAATFGVIAAPGGSSFTISESDAPGWSFVAVGCSYNNQSVGQSSGHGETVVVEPGDSVTCTFINMKLGTISGMKYNDLNRNGRKDPGEPGLAGWTIRLIGPHGTVSMVTDSNGNYAFNNLPLGVYKVRETHQLGWKRRSKNPLPVGIVPGGTITGENFGNSKKLPQEKEDTDRDDNSDIN